MRKENKTKIKNRVDKKERKVRLFDYQRERKKRDH